MKLCLGITVMILLAMSASAPAQPFDPLPAVDLSKLSPADFTDDELDVPAGGNNAGHAMPYLLAHFKTVADAVSDGTGQWPRGFIGIVVWRGERDNRPHNMRIMENNLALAYFYATDRPWNVYHGHPALRQRLEAAFEFMLGEQGPAGQFSEYVPKKWGLAPTAFGTKFLGQSLTLLMRPGAPPIDPQLLKRVVAMQRRAILFILDDPDFYTHGRRFTNQFGNVWAGGLAYLALFPDDKEVREKLEAKHASSFRDFFSPAGFPYENDGPDWGYNLGTHASNQRAARHYTRGGKPMGAGFVREERAFHEWLAYNAVFEPDGSGFVLNRAVETRGNNGFRDEPMESNFTDELPIVRAFAPTDAEVAARRARSRRDAERSWPEVWPRQVSDFNAYTPYDFLHREHAAIHPTAAQRDAARAKLLRYFADDRFNHQRVDDRRDPPPTFTFVRRPSYYAAFNSGNRRNEQRLGLGLLWNPRMGALIQSQTGSEAHAWGTRMGAREGDDDARGDDDGHLFEAQSITPRFDVAGEQRNNPPGVHDLPDGDLAATYGLGYGPGPEGAKRVTFFDDRIEVAVDDARPFREQIPLLLLPDDELTIDDGSVTLRRRGGTLRIEATGATRISRVDGKSEIGPYRVVSVHLHAKERLGYTMRIVEGSPGR